MGKDIPDKLLPEDPNSPEFQSLFIEKSKDKNFHAYRLLWMRSFHFPASFDLEINTDGSAQLTVEGLVEIGSLYTEEIAKGKSYKISKNAVKKFLGYLEKADFWNMPQNEPPRGLDGANWIIEGAKDGKYHIVDRWCPEDGPFREAALYLIELSKLKVDDIY
jgi:hypothetical protein